MSEANYVLIIDDVESQRHDISVLVTFMGYHPIAISSSYWEDRLDDIHPSDFLALYLGSFTQAEKTLPEMMARIQSWYAGIPVIVIADHTIKSLTPALQRQIIGQTEWPLIQTQFIEYMYASQQYKMQWLQAKKLGEEASPLLFEALIGKSPAIQMIREAMAKVARSDATVLITGDSGTGKEVVARSLHDYSSQKNGPFIPINCGAIPAELLESELFGHEKGAFTGAVSARKGRFELAEGGTLFLDEIGDMPLSMQVKLLRVLQERQFERVGGVESISVNVRIIAATHQNLAEMVTQQQFREDLYYRINVFPIHIPPMKDRPEDIPLIINELTKQMEQQERGSIRFSSGAMLSLCQHDWPGNVREMANLLERLLIMYPYGVIGLHELPEEFRHENDDSYETASTLSHEQSSAHPLINHDSVVLPVGGLNLKEFLASLERSLIEQALTDSNRVVARAASKLHIRRTTLVEKMRKYCLHRYAETEEIV